jgi:hypothetical protein
MDRKAGPTWIAIFENRASTYVTGSRPADVVAECKSAGLGTPSAIHYAGYSAEPELGTSDLGARPRFPPPKADKRSSRRAELVLMLYGLLRIDFPIGSILKPADAAGRLPSASSLRDFLANVGSAISRLSEDPRIIDRVVENQGKAWISAAKETNARRRGKWKAAEIHAERKIRYRQHAKRLRKRVGYQKAIGELASSIDGLLPRHELAEENFRRILDESGLSEDDIQSLISRYRRINAPKM